jgi:hypothetical protein
MVSLLRTGFILILIGCLTNHWSSKSVLPAHLACASYPSDMKQMVQWETSVMSDDATMNKPAPISAAVTSSTKVAGQMSCVAYTLSPYLSP